MCGSGINFIKTNKQTKKPANKKPRNSPNEEKKSISQIPKQGPENEVIPSNHYFLNPALRAAFQLKMGSTRMKLSEQQQSNHKVKD